MRRLSPLDAAADYPEVYLADVVFFYTLGAERACGQRPIGRWAGSVVGPEGAALLAQGGALGS
jgi:hypothetical protein